jgi:hypothetical protein
MWVTLPVTWEAIILMDASSTAPAGIIIPGTDHIIIPVLGPGVYMFITTPGTGGVLGFLFRMAPFDSPSDSEAGEGDTTRDGGDQAVIGLTRDPI